MAFIVTHPIQYYVPLYERLNYDRRYKIKVFFTRHDGGEPFYDDQFGRQIQWDLPMTSGYEFELVRGQASLARPFSDLESVSALVRAVLRWQPDAVHITGWHEASHFTAMRTLAMQRVPVLFRGDSHRLDRRKNWLFEIAKYSALRYMYRFPSAFLYVGSANKAYYREYGVPEDKLVYCPHSVDVMRFQEYGDAFESKAVQWRRSLGIDDEQFVVLFAGKLVRRKNPISVIEAVLRCRSKRLVALIVGNGELELDVRRLADEFPRAVKLLSFQNQTAMPVVYRLGDCFVLPSDYGETWGLAVNEALSCGRPVIVSDAAGCAMDLVRSPYGAVYKRGSGDGLMDLIKRFSELPDRELQFARAAAAETARSFDIVVTKDQTIKAFEMVRRCL
jgi:glycosyltransferase involved in cell wall biosynthesis